MTINSPLKFKKNIYSQNGEDGIIEYIFNTIGVKKGNFIEFGAWDGKHLSNCCKLINENWTGIYIEVDIHKFATLYENFGSNNAITIINKMVSYTDYDNLDIIIDNCSHKNKVFDFISIDVDGLDYNIFKKMKKYLPKVICIEVNAGHSPLYNKEIDINIAKNNIGQSIQIICNEAEIKGYFPLCYTGNLFLIKNEYKHLFNEDIKNIKDIYLDFLTYLGKDGIQYLYETFIIKQYYNGFFIQNDILKQFCDLYI